MAIPTPTKPAFKNTRIDDTWLAMETYIVSYNLPFIDEI